MTKQKIDLVKYIPLELRNERNTSLLANLFNRFLSEEQSVSINGQVGIINDTSAAVIEAPDFDRDQNALIPAITFKTGTEEHVFTFTDFVARLDALGVNTDNLHSTLAEQSLNYAPPIDFDKFINFSNYYWFGKIAGNKPSMPWNSTFEPEYYVQKQPSRTSIIKMPVKYVATRDLRLYGKDRRNETVTVTMISPTMFILTGSEGTLYTSTIFTGTGTTTGQTLVAGSTKIWVYAPDITDPASGGYGRGDASTSPDLLFTFTITLGSVPFEIGDKFEIDIEYITGSNSIAFISSSTTVTGKGYISNIVADASLMRIDSSQLFIGDRVLVTNQINPYENGVYSVSAGKWVRSTFYNDEIYWPLNSIVYVTNGVTNAGSTWTLTARPVDGVFVLDDPVNGNMTFTKTSTTAPSPVTDWQTTNFWAHREALSAVGLLDKCVQATRPIIEYDGEIQLNSSTDANGYPTQSGAYAYTQKKNKFNQIPQFDLFYYDGTHAKKTSGIFFYVEDPDYPVDVQLQKRLKFTINSDYIFGTGIQDEEDRLLYFKNNGALKTIWADGVTVPTFPAAYEYVPPTIEGVNLPLTVNALETQGLSTTLYGNAVVSGGALQIPDIASWLEVALPSNHLDFTGDFSIKCEVNGLGTPGYGVVLSIVDESWTQGWEFTFGRTYSYWQDYDAGGVGVPGHPSGGFTSNASQWYTLEARRVGTQVYYLLNNVVVNTTTNSPVQLVQQGPAVKLGVGGVIIGGNRTFAGDDFTGQIRNVRITTTGVVAP